MRRSCFPLADHTEGVGNAVEFAVHCVEKFVFLLDEDRIDIRVDGLIRTRRPPEHFVERHFPRTTVRLDYHIGRPEQFVVDAPVAGLIADATPGSGKAFGGRGNAGSAR